MKKSLFVYTFLITLFLTGCGNEQEPDPYSLNKISLENMPVCEIECVKSGDYALQVPEQDIIEETKGEIIDYLIIDDKLYLLISYDFYYNSYYSQMALYEKQSDDEFMQVASGLYDEGVVAGFMRYEDNIVWNEVTEANQWYECTINNNEIARRPIDESEAYNPYNQSDDWQKNISEEYLTEKVKFIGSSEDYTVWEQWEDENNLYQKSYINVLDKNTDMVSRLYKEDYGIVHTPVFVKDKVVFLTIDDIKSYENPKDFYGNVYILDLPTMNCNKMTENYGSENTLDTIIYDEPRVNDEYAYFYSRIKEGSEFTYEYIYYIN